MKLTPEEKKIISVVLAWCKAAPKSDEVSLDWVVKENGEIFFVDRRSANAPPKDHTMIRATSESLQNWLEKEWQNGRQYYLGVPSGANYVATAVFVKPVPVEERINRILENETQ